MKVLNYLLVLLLILTSCKPSYLNEIDEIRIEVKKKEYESSIEKLNKIKKIRAINSPDIFVSNMMLSEIYLEMGNIELAKKYLLESLNHNYNPYTIQNLLTYGDFRNPYNSDKDYLSRELIKIYLSEEKYLEAYEINKLNDSLYNYLGCGTSYFEREYFINEVNIDCSLNLKKLDDAIKYLKGGIFYLSDSVNVERLNKLVDLLEANYTREELRIIKTNAINNLQVENEADFKVYVTEFAGHKIKVRDEFMIDSFLDEELNLDSLGLKKVHGNYTQIIVKDEIVLDLLKEQIENSELIRRME